MILPKFVLNLKISMKLLSFQHSPFRAELSFHSLIDQLRHTAKSSGNEESARAKQLLKEIELYPELEQGITDPSWLDTHADIVKQLIHNLFPEELSLNEIKAVTIPYSDIIFNHTERFRNILKTAGSDFKFSIRDFDEHQSYVLSCCLILNEYYHTSLDFSKPLFYDIPSANGTIRHYRILYNADYLDIFPTEKRVMLTAEDIEQLINNFDDLDLWKEKFPEESWLLKGFAIMSLVDVTVENAVSILKERLLQFEARAFEESIEPVFQSIYRTPDIRIGFTLYNQDEDSLSIAAFGSPMRSFILPDHASHRPQKALCQKSYQKLIVEKQFFAVSDTEEFIRNNPDSALVSHFLCQNINSFILAPVHQDDKLVGVLEVVSGRSKELNSINAHKLDVVMPSITDNIKRLIAEFQNQVQVLIQQKYTSIHDSVYWKFKEEAKKMIYNKFSGKSAPSGEIVFPGVYPLYGQIDIKGSSASRNLSVQKDLKAQVKALLSLLSRMKELSAQDLFKAEKMKLEAYLKELYLPLNAGTEQQISDYIETQLHVCLRKLSNSNLREIIDDYLRENDKSTGLFYTYRRKYEATISIINEKMASIIDQRQVEAQKIFPHYFERFRTDGIEHNLYIGQSISPHNNFSANTLHQLRLWQLRTLCEMEIAHQILRPALPYSLDVTTLVLVFTSTIDIRFRMDEKQFDIDGSYNARFVIVKKRLDKACIKNTEERITQPGKITIVYTKSSDRLEYEQYIQELQRLNILGQEIEHFEVEDLQGVSGLEALRVSINRH